MQAVTVTGPARDVMLAEARAREDRARRALVLSLAGMEHAHAQAVRRLEQLDQYLSAVKGQLRHAGYLTAA